MCLGKEVYSLYVLRNASLQMDFSEFLLDKTSYGVRLMEKNSLTQINPW